MKKEFSVTRAEKRGPRSHQEDWSFYKRIKNPNCRGWLLAIMDGHRGSSVAELCAKEIENLFVLQDADHTEEALLHLVSGLNAKTLNHSDGSTLSVAYILEDQCRVSIAILGDSPVVVLNGKGHLHVSPEHNVRSNLKERKAAEERGGMYQEGYIFEKFDRGYNRGLQMSRALGDADLGSVLSREPEIYTITDPQWILVASDGLFDPTHSKSQKLFEEILEYAKLHASATDLMNWAVSRGLSDNATALVWSFSQK